MRSPNVVVDIANWNIERVEVILTGGDRNSSFVTPADDMAERRAMGYFVFCHLILKHEICESWNTIE